MKRFLKDIGIFLVLGAMVLGIITYVTDKGLQRSNHKSLQVWNDIYHGSINAEAVILGNSHAWVHLDPGIIDTATHINTYNLGLDAYLFDIQYARYSFYRKHNIKPRLIIQCIDYFEFDKSGGVLEKAQFLPYLGDNDLNDAITKVGMEPYYKYLPFLKYQQQAEYVGIGFRNIYTPPLQDTERLYKGYRGMDRYWDQAAFEGFRASHPYYNPEMDNAVFEQFKQFLEECRRDTIQVLMVMTPVYKEFNDLVHFQKTYKQLMQATATKYGADFLDYTTLDLCLDTANFYNGTHMNKMGAEKFSERFAQDLKHIYKRR